MQVLLLSGGPSGAKYISGTLTLMGVVHQEVHLGWPVPGDLSRFDAVLIADYPHAGLVRLEPLLARAHKEFGLGIAMFGGVKAYASGGYRGSALAELLPVEVAEERDHVPSASGFLMEQRSEHPVLRGLDLERPVMVCGINRLVARPHTTTPLVFRSWKFVEGAMRLSSKPLPALVLRESGDHGGRTLAFATGLLPPCSGGLTEWGEKRYPLGDTQEVGEGYATFLMNMVRWVAGEETATRSLPSFDTLVSLSNAFTPEIRAEGAANDDP